jgi:hypothetical protein
MNTRTIVLRLVFLLCCLVGLPSAQSARVQTGLKTNMFQLLANPERFDGKTVRVIGYLTMGHEADFLYPYESDATNLIVSNRIGIVVPQQLRSFPNCRGGKYVRVVATFKKLDEDQSGIGAFTDVRACDLWSDPAAPLSETLHSIPGVK